MIHLQEVLTQQEEFSLKGKPPEKMVADGSIKLNVKHILNV